LCLVWPVTLQSISSVAFSEELFPSPRIQRLLTHRSQTNRKRPSFSCKCIPIQRLRLSLFNKLHIKMPYEHRNCHPQLHQSKTYISHLIAETYGLPIQFRGPYEKGIQADLWQISSPLSFSSHRVGTKDSGLEKLRSSCMIV
jgi:hypothetical protein